MACTSITIPEYLHWDGITIFSSADFNDEDEIYRIGNPIAFPNGTMTALSCKWSHLIKIEDVLIADDPPKGDDFCYATVKEIREHFNKEKKVAGEDLGWHKLTCALEHTPKECDQSHCEIFIQHYVYEDEEEHTQIKFELCTYELWQEEKCLLQKGGAFYKQLRKDYRRDMIALFKHRK